MCFCECDIINVKIHLAGKEKYPGIKYNNEVLTQVAEHFGFKWSTEVDALSQEQRSELADQLIQSLPKTDCPKGVGSQAA